MITNKLILMASLSLVCAASQAHTIGIHTVSRHAPSYAWQNNNNIGGYVRMDSGLVAGAYRNTMHATSMYIGYALDAGWGALTVGVVSGYGKRMVDGHQRGGTSIMPLIAPSVKLPDFLGVTPRITLIPPVGRFAAVAHLSFEYRY
jgi:hypothetical protein